MLRRVLFAVPALVAFFLIAGSLRAEDPQHSFHVPHVGAPSRSLACLHHPEHCAAAERVSVAAKDEVQKGETIPEGEAAKLPDPWVVPKNLPAKPAVCPDRYLTVNTHTWGRHHNQLQSVMHALVAARQLNRTFVVGHFRHAKKWYPATDLYSFAEVAKHFCIVEAAQLRPAPGGVHCFGQTIDDLPHMKRHGKCWHAKFPKSFPIPQFKEYVAKAVAMLQQPDVAATRIVNLQGQVAFYMRPGLHWMSIAYGLLRPAPAVAAEVESFSLRAYGAGADYLGVHLRNREGTCDAELETDFVKTFTMSDATLQSLRQQCKVDYAYATRVFAEALGEDVIAHSGAEPNRLPYPAFLASDHQNIAVETELVNRGAIMYSGKFGTQEIGGLPGLATDYFLLRNSHTFVGNTASSVSQNTCFARLLRLPWRRACAGWDFKLLSQMTDTAAVDIAANH